MQARPASPATGLATVPLLPAARRSADRAGEQERGAEVQQDHGSDRHDPPEVEGASFDTVATADGSGEGRAAVPSTEAGPGVELGGDDATACGSTIAPGRTTTD